MIRIYNDTKIYVQCTGDTVSGGAELLHQLVSYLRNHGMNAYMVYFGKNTTTIADDYKDYNIELADHIEDSPHNISILYEPCFNQALKKTSIQIILWWLSVDFFFKTNQHTLALRDLWSFNKKVALIQFFKRLAKLFVKRKNFFFNTLSIKKLINANVLSAYQSEDAQNFLQNKGFKETVPLKDYINKEHFKAIETANREDIVLYNPKKGFEFTRKLIKRAPDINWVPIINMSRHQVIETMKKAKIYIDFGFHPGKDRLPRECAMNGLCVITGRRGSAAYFEDVWIENKYKFNGSISEIDKILNTIRNTLKNYEQAITDFAFYRNQIQKEESEFEQQVKNIFLNDSLKNNSF